MEHLPDPDDPLIRETAGNLHRGILPYLRSADHGQFVKGMIKEELIRYEAQFVRDPHGILAMCAVGVLGLMVGFFAGSL